MSVKIVVDSTVDLHLETREKVSLVPMTIRFGDQEFRDGITIDAKQFYDMLAESEELPTTSQPTPVDFEDVFRPLVEAGDEVVVITISSRLSGTYQSATIAASEFPGKVFVVDSRTAAVGSAVLTEYALRLVEQGLTGAEILEELMKQRNRVRLCAVVDTLEYLKKGGRLSSTVAFVGGMLNLKPLIEVEDGELKVLGTARGMKKAYSQLTQLCARHGGVDETMPVVLGYTGNNDQQLRDYMEYSRDLWHDVDRVSAIGATIGVHAGPGAFAAAFFSKE